MSGAQQAAAPSADLTAEDRQVGTFLARCLVSRSTVYRASEEVVEIRLDERVASTTKLQVMVPASDPMEADRLLPVALVRRDHDGPTPAVTIDGGAAHLVSEQEARRCLALAITAMALASDDQLSVDTSTVDGIEAAIARGSLRAGDHLVRRIAGIQATDASEWLQIALRYRILMVAVPSTGTPQRRTVEVLAQLKPLQLGDAGLARRVLAAAGRETLPFHIERTVVSDFPTTLQSITLTTPHGVTVVEASSPRRVAARWASSEAPAVNLRLARPGLIGTLKVFALLCAALLVAGGTYPGLIARLALNTDGLLAVVLVGPSILVSTFMRPELGQLLRRFLLPLQATAAVLCVFPAWAFTALVSETPPRWQRPTCYVLATLAALAAALITQKGERGLMYWAPVLALSRRVRSARVRPPRLKLPQSDRLSTDSLQPGIFDRVAGVGLTSPTR